MAVRISGSYVIPGVLRLTIKGTWDGLAFTKTETVHLPISLRGSELASSLCAYQKSETLRMENYTGNVEAIKELGREHHVVNSQMSLIALEPGMELWEELPNSDQNANSGAEVSFIANDVSYLSKINSATPSFNNTIK